MPVTPAEPPLESLRSLGVPVVREIPVADEGRTVADSGVGGGERVRSECKLIARGVRGCAWLCTRGAIVHGSVCHTTKGYYTRGGSLREREPRQSACALLVRGTRANIINVPPGLPSGQSRDSPSWSGSSAKVCVATRASARRKTRAMFVRPPSFPSSDLAINNSVWLNGYSA